MSRSLLWSKKLAKEMTCERKYGAKTFLMSHFFLILTISQDPFCRSFSVYKLHFCCDSWNLCTKNKRKVQKQNFFCKILNLWDILWVVSLYHFKCEIKIIMTPLWRQSCATRSLDMIIRQSTYVQQQQRLSFISFWW